MATGLKKHYSDIRFSGNLVTPDEIDRYEVYSVVNPTTQNTWIGTAASTASGAAAPTFGFISKMADYPRSLRVVATTGSGTAIQEACAITGKDQFGNTITETITALGTTTATAIGTKVFAEVTAVTVTQGTITADVGTVALGLGTAGTTTLFGLPFKLGGTADVVLYRWQSNGTSVPVNASGSTGMWVDATYHAVKAVTDIGGTTALQVWVKPSYNAENEVAPRVSNLTQLA